MAIAKNSDSHNDELLVANSKSAVGALSVS